MCVEVAGRRMSYKVPVYSSSNQDPKYLSAYVSQKSTAWATLLDFSLLFMDLVLEYECVTSGLESLVPVSSDDVYVFLKIEGEIWIRW